MTDLRERHEVDAVAAPAPTVQRGPWARPLADLRLARRQVLSGWTSSLLVVLLIVLPMALVTGALVYAEGRQPTTDERIRAEVGDADAWVSIVSGPDPSLFQYLDQPEWWEIARDDNGSPVNEPQPMPDSPAPFLPAGLETIEIGEGTVTVETAGGIAPMTAVVGDAGAGALRGRFDLHGRFASHGGHAATGDDEAMVSPGALARLGARVGDTLTLTEPAGTYTITGVLSRAEDPDAAEVVFLPGTAANRALQSDPFRTRWYVPKWSPTPEEVAALNREGIIVFDRDLVANPGTGAAPGDSSALNWTVLGLVSAAAAFAGYLIVLLAGAAFSVSARRQQRSLAVAASVGATRGDVFRIVLLQGTVLGLAGGLGGAAAGIGLGILFLHLLDDGAVSTFWGVHIPWSLLIAVVLFAVVVGTLAALLPARAATRGEVIAALRGSRGPVSVRVDRPLWGSLLLIVGVAVTALSALWLAAINAEEFVSSDDARRVICIWGIILGPLLLQVGVILAGHWIISLLSRVLSRWGLAPRIASRDAAAHPGRIVPAFAAIAACAFLASVTLGGLAITTKQTERGWWHNGPVGTLSVHGWMNNDPSLEEAVTPELAREKEAAARDILVRTEPVSMGTIWNQFDAAVYDDSWKLTNPEATTISPQLQEYVSCDPERSANCLTRIDAMTQGNWYVAVVDPDELATVVGRSIPASDLKTYRDGGALALDGDYVTADGSIVLNELRIGDLNAAWKGAVSLEPVATTTVPAVVVDLGQLRNSSVLLSPAAAERAGFVTGPWQVIAAYDEPPPPSVRDAAARDVVAIDSRALSMSAQFENGPADAAPWLLLVVGATAVLVVGASAVALGLARVERRPDDATLAAVGGSRRLRRGIAGWQAVIIAGIGMVTGVVAGILPVWGVCMASEAMTNPPLFSDLPWAWLAALAVGLPLTIAVVSWLVPPRAPDLTRRTAIA